MTTSTTNFIEKYNKFWDNKKYEEKQTVITEQEDEKGSGSNSSNNINSEDANNTGNLFNLINNFADLGEELQTDTRHRKKKKIEKIKVFAIDITNITE